VTADTDLDLVAMAYAEDLGNPGDITTNAIVPAEARTNAIVVARSPGCVAGVDAAMACFRHIDPSLALLAAVEDGTVVDTGTTLIEVSGSTRSILTAERVALNLLGHLSGIATATRACVDAVAGSGTRISDTRKTTPGLRGLEKRAVVSGGGVNHRFGLFDQVLIKDNHLAAAPSIAAAVASARASVGPDVRIEVEVDTIDQLRRVLDTDADAVLLDNMTVEDLTAAVALVGGRIETEASGGVTLDTVAAIAATGVDVISIGWLTHSAPALDVAMDVVG
jgi:nicotinate-nucleotide pyrophosphorylase (carboxylating)